MFAIFLCLLVHYIASQAKSRARSQAADCRRNPETLLYDIIHMHMQYIYIYIYMVIRVHIYIYMESESGAE